MNRLSELRKARTHFPGAMLTLLPVFIVPALLSLLFSCPPRCLADTPGDTSTSSPPPTDPPPAEVPETILATESYQFIGDGYTVTVPAGWSFLVNGDADLPGWTLDPHSLRKAELGVVVSPVIIESNPHLQNELDAMIKECQRLSDYKFLDSGLTTIGITPAAYLDFDDADGYNRWVMFVRKHLLYIVSGSASKDAVDDQRATLAAFGNSFRFIGYDTPLSLQPGETAFRKYGYALNVPKGWHVKVNGAWDNEVVISGGPGQFNISLMSMPQIDQTLTLVPLLDIYNKSLLKAQPHLHITRQTVTILDGRQMISTVGVIKTQTNPPKRYSGLSGKAEHGDWFTMYYIGSGSDVAYDHLIKSLRWTPR